MRLGRFRKDGLERIGSFEDGSVLDVSAAFDSFSEAIAQPEHAINSGGDRFDREDITYLPPIEPKTRYFVQR